MLSFQFKALRIFLLFLWLSMPLVMVSCSGSPGGGSQEGSKEGSDDPSSSSGLPPAREVSQTYTQVTATAPTVRSGQEITITIELRDDKLNRFKAGGHEVAFHYSQGSSIGTFSPVVDHLDGTYSTRFKGLVAGTPIQISATVAGKLLLKTTQVAVLPGAPSEEDSSLAGVSTSEDLPSGTVKVPSSSPNPPQADDKNAKLLDLTKDLIRNLPPPPVVVKPEDLSVVDQSESSIDVSPRTILDGGTTKITLKLRTSRSSLVELDPEKIHFTLLSSGGGTVEATKVVREKPGIYSARLKGIYPGVARFRFGSSGNTAAWALDSYVEIEPVFSLAHSHLVGDERVKAGESIEIGIRGSDKYGNYADVPDDAEIVFTHTQGAGVSTGKFKHPHRTGYVRFRGIKVGLPTIITATVNGHPVDDKVSVSVIPGDPYESVVSVVKSKLNMGEKTEVKLRLRDIEGNYTPGRPEVGVSFALEKILDGSSGEFTQAVYLPDEEAYQSVFTAKGSGYPTPVTTSWSRRGVDNSVYPTIEVLLPTIFSEESDKEIKLVKPPVRQPFKGNLVSVPGVQDLPTNEYKDLNRCFTHYKEEWINSDQIAKSLESRTPLDPTHPASGSGSCWNSEQLLELASVREAIERDLGELKNKNAQANQPTSETNQEYRSLLFRLGQNYQIFQEHLSYCRLKDLIQQGKRPAPVEAVSSRGVTDADRQLLNVMGDMFGLESGIEGQTVTQALSLFASRIGILRTLMKQLEGQRYIATARQAYPCSDIPGGYHPNSLGHMPPIKDFEIGVLKDIVAHGEQAEVLRRNFDTSLSRFYSEYIRALDGLKKVGDWFYFPAGSTKHAVVYQVRRNEDSSYSFGIYNSGSGLDFHASVSEGSRKLVYPRFERTHVSFEKIKQISFLKSLRDLTTSDGNSKMPFVYDNILLELGGTVTTVSPLLEDFLPPQLAGNCTYFVFPYMQTALFGDSSLGSFLEFFVKSKLLDTYIRVNANRLSSEDHALRLANQTLHFYSEEIAKNISPLPGHRDYALDWGMARESQERLEFYREQLSNQVSERKRIRAKKNEESVASLFKYPKSFPDFKLTDLVPILFRKDVPIQIQALDVDSWVPNPKDLTQDLTKFFGKLRPVSKFETDDRLRETQRIIAGVEEIVKKLQLQGLKFLPSSPYDQRELLGQLNDLSQLYFWALVNARSSGISQNLGISPLAILTQLKLMALADATLRAYSLSEQGRELRGFPSLYSRLFDFFVNTDPKKLTSLMSIEDSTWDSSFKEVAAYWGDARSRNPNGVGFFEWEKIPLYGTQGAPEIYRNIYDLKDEQDDDRSVWSNHRGLMSSDVLWMDLVWAKNKVGPEALRSLTYSTYSPNLLPVQFFEMRDISFMTHYLLSGSFNPLVLRDSLLKAALSDVSYFEGLHESRISRPVSVQFIPKEPKPRTQYSTSQFTPSKLLYIFFGNRTGGLSEDLIKTLKDELQELYVESYYRKFYVGAPNLSLALHGDRAQLGLWREVIETPAAYLDKSSPTSAGHLPFYKRLTSEQIISEAQAVTKVPLKKDASQHRELAVTSLEMQRQLLNLDTPLITLAYFREHPGLLLEKSWQVLFKSLIFQPDLLANEFAKTSNFADLLTTFCWNQYEKESKDGDLLTAGFFLRMHQLFEEFISKSRIPRVASYRVAHRARDGFNSLMSGLPKTVSDTRSLLYRDLIRTYRYEDPSKWTSSEIATLLTGILYRDRNPLKDGTNIEPSEEDAVSNLYLKKRVALLARFEQLTETQRQDILNEVYREFHPQASVLTFFLKQDGFSKSYSARDAGNREVKIDLDRPLILLDQGREVVLPGKISGFPKFKEIVGWSTERPLYVTWLGGDKYQLEDQNDHHPVLIDATPVAGKEQGSFIIEKKWGTVWYQLLDDTLVNNIAVHSGGGWKPENWVVMPGYQNWQSVRVEADGPKAPPIYEEKITDTDLRLNWSRMSPKDSGKEILSFDAKTKKLFSVSRSKVPYSYLTNQKAENIIQKVKYSGETATLEGKILSPGENENLAILSRIETPRFVWIWTNAKGGVEELEFPRFKVSFYADQGRFVSPELDSFVLSKNQTFPGLHEYPHYLVVEKEGKEAVLMPRFQFVERNRGAFDKERGLFPHFELRWFDQTPEESARTQGRAIERFARGSKKLFFFPVDSISKELVYSDIEERLYLAMVHLWMHSPEYSSYDLARELIYSTRSELGDFRKFSNQVVVSGARELLGWISQLKNNDFDPRSLALQLGAGLQILENDLANHRYGPRTPKFSSEVQLPESFIDKIFVNNLALLYHHFLKTRDRISTRWLPEDLERLYLRLLSAQSELGLSSRFKARLVELEGGTDEATAPVLPEVSPGILSATLSQSDRWSLYAISGGYSKCVDKSGNLFKGVDLDDALGVSLRLRNGQSTGRMKELVARLLGVPVSDVDTLTVNDLKEEYFGVLRVLARQKRFEGRPDDVSEIDHWGSQSCQRIAEFLYSLALTPKEVKLEYLEQFGSFSSLNQRLRQFEHESRWDWDTRTKPYSEELARVIVWKAEEPVLQLAAWGAQAPQVRPVRFWDPRKDSSSDSFPSAVPPSSGGEQAPYYDRMSNPHSKYDLTETPVLSDLDLSDCVSETDLAATEKILFAKSKQELKTVFEATPLETQTPDPFISTRLTHVNAQLDVEIFNKSYHLMACPNSAALKAALETQKRELVPKISELRTQIQKAAHALPKDAWKKTRESIYLESQIEHPSSFMSILHAYANKDLRTVMTDAGSQSAVRDLGSQVSSYLILSTYLSRLEETLTGLEKTLKTSTNEDLKSFYQLATQLRAYKIEDHPEFLVFEYNMRSLIRKDQLEKLKTLTAEEGAILEMIMGAGKTSVLLPLACRANAIANEKLSVVVLPESLVPSVGRQLGAQLEKNFGLGVDRLTISRSHRYDLAKLEFLYHRLIKDLETQRVVVTSNSSIQSLVLIFVEALLEHQENTSVDQRARIRKEITQLQQIFSLLKSRAHVIIDEIDSILDIMASHRFSVGTREYLENELVDATAGLFRLMAESKTIPKKVTLSFIRQSYPGATPFTTELYHQWVKGELIQAIARKESAEYFFGDPKQVAFFQALDMEGVKEFFAFQTRSQIESYLEGLPNDGMKDVFATLYTQIHQTLPMTLDKSYLVHYGLCPESALTEPTPNGVPPCHPFIAVPYHSGSPVLTSRFGTDLESLNYTIQSHLERGDFGKLFGLEIRKLQGLFRSKKSARIRSKIQEYFGRPLGDSQILGLTDSEIFEQAKVIAKIPKPSLQLVKSYAVPKIEVYPAQLFTNSHIYPLLFKNIKGMTGTLWNFESFPEFYKTKPRLSDSLARTLIALMKNADTRNVEVIDIPLPSPAASAQSEDEARAEEVRKILEAMFRGRANLSIIDQGGLLRGKDNQLVAQLMLAISKEYRTYQDLSSSASSDGSGDGGDVFQNSTKNISQIIFYDESHQIQVLRQDLTVEAYVSDKIDRFKTGAFWDMQHTTGSDLKIQPQGRALLTLSKFSILRDLLQSAWRLRGLEREQSVMIVISRDDLRVMSKLLTTHYGPAYALSENAVTVPLEKVLLYLATHEAIKVGEANFRSVKGSLKAVVIQTIFRTLLTQDVEGELLKGFSKVEAFFKTPKREAPRVRYGIPILENQTDGFLLKETHRIFGPASGLFGNLEALKEKFQWLIAKKRPSMRAIVKTAETVDFEDSEEVEIEAENEQEQEEEEEQEKEFLLHDKAMASYRQQTVGWSQQEFIKGNIPLANENDLKCQDRDVSRLPSIVSLRTVFSSSSLIQYQDLFDKRLYGSLNLFPVYKCSDEGRSFVPFGIHQGQIDHFMVVLDAQKKIEMVVLLTRDEALKKLGEWLHEMREKGQGPGQKSVYIYQFGNGFIRAAGPDIRSDAGLQALSASPGVSELEQSEKLRKLLVQAKLLSGRVDFTPLEKALLIQWMSNAGNEATNQALLKEFFENVILRFKESTRELYEHSVLHEVLGGLSSESQASDSN